ncbi:MAG: type II secretion system GspH family protein [Planctomycetia bacterium]|nr:type II secretion system GspH family protein [Planctomycetia bacterium]
MSFRFFSPLASQRGVRRALTLIELVVVLAILSVLAAVVLPKLAGMTGQANSAVDASIISDMNRAVSTFESRNNGKFPSANDGLLTGSASTTFYSKFHPSIQTGGATATADPMLPILYPLTLSAIQAKSLNDMGIVSAHYNTESVGASSNPTGMPSDSGTAYSSITTGSNVAGLFIPLGGYGNTATTPPWTAHGSTFPDRAFNLNPFNYGKTDSFVVFGVGQPGELRGKALQDAPIVQAANPTKYYSRMLIVFRIPGIATTATYFPAQYVGSFAPDGTCLSDNVRAFNNGAN